MVHTRVVRVLGSRRRRILAVLASAVLTTFTAFAAVAVGPSGADASGPNDGGALLTSTCGNAAPQISMPAHHLIVLFMENESRGAIVGTPSAPYQTALAAQCGEASQMFAITHPSLPNYIALHSGVDTLGTFQDCLPVYKTATCISTDDNIFAQVERAGLTWRDYAEDMPASCWLRNVANYAPRHNPAVYFSNLTTTAPGHASDCATYDIPMGDVTTQTGPFYDDLRAGALPSYTFLTPNIVDDAHSSSISAGDSYLSQLIPLITAGPNYQAGDTDIVITYDEGAGKDKKKAEDCADQALDQAGRQPSCNIPFIVVSPYEAAGTVSTAWCTLYCLTRTIEANLGLPLLGHAADPTTRDLSADFTISPVGTTSPTDTPTDTATETPTDTATSTSSTTTTTTTATTTPPTAREYVGNPGLESDLTGWLGTRNATSTITRVQIPGGSHDGSWTMQVTNGAGTTAAAGVANKKPMWIDGKKVATVAGTTYTGSVWVNGGAGTKVTLQLQECDAAGAACRNPRTAVATLAASSWTQLSVPITAGASGESISVALFGSLPAGASFLADSFSLTSPTP